MTGIAFPTLLTIAPPVRAGGSTNGSAGRDGENTFGAALGEAHETAESTVEPRATRARATVTTIGSASATAARVADRKTPGDRAISGKAMPEKATASRPIKSRITAGAGMPAQNTMRAADGDTAGEQPNVVEPASPQAALPPEGKSLGTGQSTDLPGLPLIPENLQAWDSTSGSSPRGGTQAESVGSALQDYLAAPAHSPAAIPTKPAEPTDSGDGSVVKQALDTAEADPTDGDSIKDPAPQTVPVAVLLQVPRPIPQPVPESTPDSTDSGDSSQLPSTFGRAGSINGPTIVGTPIAPHELTLEPGAAVRLRIKTSTEATGMPFAANLSTESRTEEKGLVEPRPTESRTITARPVGPNITELEFAPARAGQERDARYEGTAEASPTVSNKSGDREAAVRIPSPFRTEMPGESEDSTAERKGTARKLVTTTVEAPKEILPAEPRSAIPAPSSVDVRASQAPAISHPRETTSPQAVPKEQLQPEPLPRAPLKSMSLEFSPDGAGDVQLKLTERAGEVHVSLHSNDAALNHQLRNGIGDLASVLAGAGYEADAWTSPDRNGRQQREQNQQPEPQSTNGGSIFELDMNQSPQEVI